MSGRYTSSQDDDIGCTWVFLGAMWLFFWLSIAIFDGDDWGGWLGAMVVASVMVAPFAVMVAWGMYDPLPRKYPDGERWVTAEVPHTYRVHPLGWLIGRMFLLALLVALGSFLVLLGAALCFDAVADGFVDGVAPGSLVILLIGAVLLYGTVAEAVLDLRSIWTIEVIPSGTIALVPRWGRSRQVQVEDITEVHVGYTLDGEGDKVWTLDIRPCTGPAIPVDYFREAERFTDHLLALNPYIAIIGPWPDR